MGPASGALYIYGDIIRYLFPVLQRAAHGNVRAVGGGIGNNGADAALGEENPNGIGGYSSYGGDSDGGCESWDGDKNSVAAYA